MTREIRQPEDLLVTGLQEIYSAEQQLTKVLPRLAKAIESERVRGMIGRRAEEAGRLTGELEIALRELDATPGGKRNEAAEGLIASAQGRIQEMGKGAALDAVLIGDVQKATHYCIAAWGVAKAFARALHQDAVTQAMERALQEGKSFDEELTRLAEREVNPAMIREGGAMRVEVRAR